MKTNQWWLAAGLMCTGLVTAACGSDKKTGDDDDSTSRDAGRLADGRVVEEDVCGKHLVKSDHAVPDMLIVLDKSGSMAPNGNATRTDRWRGSRDAVDEVTAMYDSTISFGLMTFPGTGGGFGGGRGNGGLAGQCTAGGVDVDLGPNNGAPIEQTLSRMNAAGYTPTAQTLEAALDVIGSPTFADQNVSAAKFVLLVTDGDPNCSPGYTGAGGAGGVAPPDPVARANTITAIEALTKAGVQTYVVGYQTAGTDFASVLDQMAAAGGTGEKTHQSVETGADLSAAFQTLAGKAATCSYKLSETVDVSNLTISVGGKALKYKDADGWTISGDNRTVTITGAACAAAQKGSAFTVEVYCPAVIGI